MTDEQAVRFGHGVFALMDATEWDSDTFEMIACLAAHIGVEFREMEDDEFIECSVCAEPVTVFNEGSDKCLSCEGED